MQYSKIPLAQTITTLCKQHNVAHIVISPGSRSAPLSIGFTNDDYFKCYSIVDERCAGFFALGIAQQIKQPVALVCTSGSALLNYYPAISEAYYSQIPLVVFSADRPKHLVDIGDGQTVKQPKVYGDHVHYSANLKLDLREDSKHKFEEDALPIIKSIENKSDRFLNLQNAIQIYNEAEIHKALEISNTLSGPVHINCPFDEPLYDTTEVLTITPKTYQSSSHTVDIEAEILQDNDLTVWNNAQRRLVLVGVLAPGSVEQLWLDELAKDPSVIILTETTSNLHQDDIFTSIDQLIAPLEDADFEALQPDILVTFGGMVVSKKIKVFLRNYQPKHHWHIDLHHANDTFFCLEKHFKTTPNLFFSELLEKSNIIDQNNYKSLWFNIRNKRRKLHQDYQLQIPFSDFTVFDEILRKLPKNSQLQVGNSSAIRYTQLFQLPSTITVFCNRGTSGIDGSTSTAIGASAVIKERVTFITGDLSFFYDSNALWNNYIPNSFRIIIVNNQGGGIFRILPGHKNTENFDTYFETKHQLSAEQLCKMFNIEYHSATDKKELDIQLRHFYDLSEQPKLLEIFTPSQLNDTILLDYFKFIK